MGINLLKKAIMQKLIRAELVKFIFFEDYLYFLTRSKKLSDFLKVDWTEKTQNNRGSKVSREFNENIYTKKSHFLKKI